MLSEMNARAQIESGDHALVQIVDAALAEAARKAGPWLVCRPGCTACCMGPFLISQLDALRLRQGLAQLESSDPERAARVRERAHLYVERIAPEFPGNPATGIIEESDEAENAFPELADDEPCPALDPETGTCDLYAARPMTCRTFGPPVRCHAPADGPSNPESGSEGLGVCELCFTGATEEEIASCEVELDSENLEGALIEEAERTTGLHGRTMVGFALIERG